jgi:NTE family protein
MGGGGARSAYQVGVLRGLAKRFPELQIDYLTGVSAGAINTAFLASRPTPFAQTVEDLTAMWRKLECADVFEVSGPALFGRALRVMARFVIGARQTSTPVQGLVDTAPLRRLLQRVLEAEQGGIAGITRNLFHGRLRAVALTATRYNTGQTVTFFDGANIDQWERPHRRSVRTPITVDHIMASAALPLFFPAIDVAGDYYGDGGVRMIAPLAPALHWGADRILAISTRYGRSGAEATVASFQGAPSPAQVLGTLYSAVFLDLLDHDALQLERINRLIASMTPAQRGNLRPVDLMVVRPSADLGKLADEFEARLPGAFRFMTRRLGTKKARSQDLISTVMFQSDYIGRLIELGEADADSQADAFAAFLEH